jgi:hypothetical protein
VRHFALACALGIAVILVILPSAAGAQCRHGHGAVVVASRGSVVIVPRSSVVVVSPAHRQVFVGARVLVGPRVLVGGFVGPGWWGPAWYRYPYPYPVTYASPPVIQQEAPTYAPPASTGQYWYYCPDNKTYYPYTQQCPTGWLQVVPSPRAPGPGY